MDNPNTSYQLRVQSILPSINKKNEMKIYEFIEINRKSYICLWRMRQRLAGSVRQP